MRSFRGVLAIAALIACSSVAGQAVAGVPVPAAGGAMRAQLAQPGLVSAAAFEPTNLENPYPGAHVSGIGLVSGWTCRSGVVELSFDGGPRAILVPSGGSRGDTQPVCGRSDTGFGLLINYNLLGSGNHTVELFVDGVPAGGPVPFTVTVPAGEFIQGVSRTVDVTDFPASGRTTRLEWQESTQNFAITAVSGGTSAAQLAQPGLVSAAAFEPTNLENPYPGAHVSGIGLVSGWTCRSGVVELSFDGGPRAILVPSGGSRGDTQPVCGRSDTGFGLLINYNLLGSGNHTVELFVDGVPAGGPVPFTVTVPAGEFIQGVSRTVDVTDFPASGRTTRLEWQESTQNFAITAVSGGQELVQISAQNQIAVARATVANFASLGSVSDLPVYGPASVAKAFASARVAMRALGLAATADPAALTGARPLAVYTVTELCPFGGSLTVSIDDRNKDGTLNAGDLLGMTFKDCWLDASSWIDGGVTIDIAAATDTGLSGLCSFDQLQATTDGYSAEVSGAVNCVVTEITELTGTRTVTDITVTSAGLVSRGVSPSYSDTFTYDPGFRGIWADFAPFAPTAEPYSTAALTGRLHAASLGGKIVLATDAAAPVHEWQSAPYPDSGRVTVDGYRSRLRLTVLDTTTVRLGLDANGDGVVESTLDVPWTTLLP